MPKKLVSMQDVIDLETFFEEFLAFKRAQGISERTIEDYMSHFRRFLRFCQKPPKTFDELKKYAYQYLAQPCAPGYRNMKLKYLRCFFSWCVSQEYLPASPVAGLKKSREDIDNVRHVDLDAVKKLLAQPDKHTYTGLRDYCLILTQIDTGARPGELFNLLPDDVNFAAYEIYIRPEAAKTRIARTLAISPLTARSLRKLLSVRPEWWNPDVPVFAGETGYAPNRNIWATRLRKYSADAGVKITPYSLRHTFAIEFLKGGGDVFSLQRILGHADLNMTRRYVRLSQDDVKKAHEKATPVTRLEQKTKRAPRKI